LPRLPAGWLRRSLRQRQDPYALFTPTDLDAAAAGARLKSAPGRTVRYSNFGVALLGHALATRAQLDFATLVEQRICVPLGLSDTRAVVPDADLARFADGHDRRGRPVAHWQMGVMSAAGALRSTVTDLMRFLHAQCVAAAPTEQDTPLAPELTRAIRSTQVPLHHRGRMGQGLGWMILGDGPDSGSRLLMHTGGTGGFRSYCACIPEQNVRVVVLANAARSVDKIGWALVRAIRHSTA
jgi:CubicO group peptidase (beta-lactamase class C family)